jgi:hypothetical protein
MFARRPPPVLLVAPFVLLALGAAPAGAQDDPREVEARALYARGDYDRALETFSRLYAEEADPIYLRNI